MPQEEKTEMAHFCLLPLLVRTQQHQQTAGINSSSGITPHAFKRPFIQKKHLALSQFHLCGSLHALRL